MAVDVFQDVRTNVSQGLWSSHALLFEWSHSRVDMRIRLWVACGDLTCIFSSWSFIPRGHTRLGLIQDKRYWTSVWCHNAIKVSNFLKRKEVVSTLRWLIQRYIVMGKSKQCPWNTSCACCSSIKTWIHHCLFLYLANLLFSVTNRIRWGDVVPHPIKPGSICLSEKRPPGKFKRDHWMMAPLERECCVRWKWGPGHVSRVVLCVLDSVACLLTEWRWEETHGQA